MKNRKSSINVDIGARAEAKLEIKAVVPTTSVGRLVDAFTDMIRPFSEARGLKADLIRLQREEVAFEIARRARAQLAQHRDSIKPLPNKFLIPFFEKASLEELENEELVTLWANLLASAAKNMRPAHLRYISVLSELDKSQAVLLERLVDNRFERFKEEMIHTAEDAPYLDEKEIWEFVKKNFHRNKIEKFRKAYFDKFERPGVAIVDLIIGFSSDYGDGFSTREFKFLCSYDTHFKFAVLESLKLVDKREYYFRFKDVDFSAYFYCLSQFGYAFYEACHPMDDEHEKG